MSTLREREPRRPHGIALRAYERFLARGHQHGQDVEDWLVAERELQQRA